MFGNSGAGKSRVNSVDWKWKRITSPVAVPSTIHRIKNSGQVTPVAGRGCQAPGHPALGKELSHSWKVPSFSEDTLKQRSPSGIPVYRWKSRSRDSSAMESMLNPWERWLLLLPGPAATLESPLAQDPASQQPLGTREGSREPGLAEPHPGWMLQSTPPTPRAQGRV